MSFLFAPTRVFNLNTASPIVIFFQLYAEQWISWSSCLLICLSILPLCHCLRVGVNTLFLKFFFPSFGIVFQSIGISLIFVVSQFICNLTLSSLYFICKLCVCLNTDQILEWDPLSALWGWDRMGLCMYMHWKRFDLGTSISGGLFLA